MYYTIEIGDFEHPLDGPHPTDWRVHHGKRIGGSPAPWASVNPVRLRAGLCRRSGCITRRSGSTTSLLW